MRSQRLTLLAVLTTGLVLTSCKKDKEPVDTGDINEESDTDTDTDTDADTDTADGDSGSPEPSCTAAMKDTEPEDGATAWYWKDTITVDFESAPEEQDIITITDAAGTPVAASFDWEDHGETVNITAELTGATEYVMTVNCLEEETVGFTTSEYGVPLTISPDELLNRTYELDLPGAYFKEPTGVGALLGTYLENPLLASPVAITDTEITMLVAQGLWDDEGVASQDLGMDVFPFPPSDWVSAPYFSGDTEQIIVTYATSSSVTEIVIHDVHLEGTFAADGSSLGGAWASGLADTRNLGPLLDLPGASDSPSVVCDYLISFGLPCLDCGDGEELCLYMEAYFDDAPVVDGVSLDPDPLGTSAR